MKRAAFPCVISHAQNGDGLGACNARCNARHIQPNPPRVMGCSAHSARPVRQLQPHHNCPSTLARCHPPPVLRPPPRRRPQRTYSPCSRRRRTARVAGAGREREWAGRKRQTASVTGPRPLGYSKGCGCAKPVRMMDPNVPPPPPPPPPQAVPAAGARRPGACAAARRSTRSRTRPPQWAPPQTGLQRRGAGGGGFTFMIN